MENAIVKTNDEMISIHFDSILDLMEHEATGRNANRFNRFLTDYESDPSWYGKTNGGEAKQVIDHALIGDQKLYDGLSEKVSDFASFTGLNNIDTVQKIKSSKRKIKRGDFGDEFDIHKMYSGNLENAWTRRVRVENDSQHKLVTLFINVCGTMRVDAEDSLWRAVVALRLYQDLQRAGKSVKIIVGGGSANTFESDSRKCSFSIVVKEYNQALSVERLAAMSHVGFHRVFGFAAKCAHDEAQVESSLGKSVNASNNYLPINLKEELDVGHTRILFINKSTSLMDAKADLDSLYNQLQDLQKEI